LKYGRYCDDRFHLKPTKPGLAMEPDLSVAPADDGAKPSMVVPVDKLDDADWPVQLTRATMANLPTP
jgi:hypothetical protein